MSPHHRAPLFAAALSILLALSASAAAGRPFAGGQFQGRIAYSADGNHNVSRRLDGVARRAGDLRRGGSPRNRLVHFDYNSILIALTNPEWEKTHAESVLGAARLHGYDLARFFDDRRDLDGAIASLVRAINASTADDPLYFIIAGPMEVPQRALQQADRARLPHVYCISHSNWNDGFAANYQFRFTKRSVIEQGVHWVQIQDQNRRLSFGRYGTAAKPAEFAPYFWMRDSTDPEGEVPLGNARLVSTRPDPSDAGMAWFLATGDEE